MPNALCSLPGSSLSPVFLPSKVHQPGLKGLLGSQLGLPTFPYLNACIGEKQEVTPSLLPSKHVPWIDAGRVGGDTHCTEVRQPRQQNNFRSESFCMSVCQDSGQMRT